MVGDMLYQRAGCAPRSLDRCRYDGSRLLFRGPRRRLEGEYVACLGGTETFGKYVAHPYPDLLEGLTGITCVNFGWPNAGVDVFANDRALLDCAGRARLCVLQVPCAVNMSNRYYRVHPRRNDRFLTATEPLEELFGEVDFTEFSFTRHMLGRLQAVSPDRFTRLRAELADAWVAGMKTLITRIGAPVVLLWLSARAPDEGADRPDIGADPALVNGEMLAALRGHVEDLVEIPIAEVPQAPGRAGPRDALDPATHERAAQALVPAVARLLHG